MTYRTCVIGSATTDPCPRTATEFVDTEDAPNMCAIHARITALQDAVSTIEVEIAALEMQDRLERGF